MVAAGASDGDGAVLFSATGRVIQTAIPFFAVEASVLAAAAVS